MVMRIVTILAWAFVNILVFASELLQEVFRVWVALTPDAVHRMDAPFEPSNASYTYDGRQIID